MADLSALLSRCTFAPAGTDVVCGLSGGADSTALVVLAIEAGCVVTAVHVHHGLRPGADHDADVAATTARAPRHRFPRRARRGSATDPTSKPGPVPHAAPHSAPVHSPDTPPTIRPRRSCSRCCVARAPPDSAPSSPDRSTPFSACAGRRPKRCVVSSNSMSPTIRRTPTRAFDAIASATRSSPCSTRSPNVT